MGFQKAYLSYRRDHTCDWKKIEYPVCHPQKIYPGTLDRYGTVDGLRTILDFKTTYSIDPAHRKLYTAAQNLYRRAIEDYLPVDQIIIKISLPFSLPFLAYKFLINI